MLIYKGKTYTTLNGSLAIKVIAIHYQTDEKIKCKLQLTNKFNGVFYQTKNYTLETKNISHWTRL